MARRRTFPTLALAALLGAACGDIDAGRNNEDTGIENGDLTPGDTRSGTAYSVSADTATPISAQDANASDSVRNVAAAAGDSVPGEPAPARGRAGGTPQPSTQPAPR